MKILITNYDASVFGGTERMVVNLANLLSKKGAKVTIYSLYKSRDSLPFKIDPNVHVIFGRKQSSFYNLCLKFMIRLRCDAIFYRILEIYHSFKMRNWDYDVVISNSYDRIIPYFKNAKTKYIKVAHGNFKAYLGCRGIGYFDHLVVLSDAELSLWREKYPNLGIHTIPNFLNPIPDEQSDLSQKIVIAVGRLAPEKGFCRLLEIWANLKCDASLKEWKLHIIGDGILRETLQAQIKANNIADSVWLKPFTSEIGKEFTQGSIYAMTSFFEGFPMVLLEACSYALPIVAFDISTGPSEVIEHGQNGFLIQDDHCDQFCEALKKLMLDQNLRESLGKAGKKRVEQRFAQDVIYEKWKALIN